MVASNHPSGPGRESPRQPPSQPSDSSRGSPPYVRWFASASDAQKQAAIHALLAVAAGDGEISPEEKVAIAQACERLGLRSLDVAQAIASGMPSGIEAPRELRARAELLLDAAAVMVADRRIDPRELAVLLMIGKSLDFTADQVTEAAMCAADSMRSDGARGAAIDRFLRSLS